MRLHPQLAADCHLLGSFEEGQLLLHRNASLPWLLLVPDTEEELLYRIAEPLRSQIIDRWHALAAWMHGHFECDRVNTAAIGNVVPQLHLHIVGRRAGDPAWPGVVWGHPLPDSSWTAKQLEALRAALQTALGLLPPG
jgi:diadenosine tetraphosphate (Ap4A) HIT family hydrolase